MIPTYLVKSSQNRYYFRIIIPKDLRAAFGKREIRRSVLTTNQTLATARSLQMALFYQQEFGRLRMPTFEDVIDNPLSSKILTIEDLKVNGFSAKKVTIENEEDREHLQSLIDNASNRTEGIISSDGLVKTDTEKDLKIGSFASQPITSLIQDYLSEKQSSWEPNVFNEYKALYRQVVQLITPEMRTKTKNAPRITPIHSAVLSLGFIDFVEWRKKNIAKNKMSDKRLFIDLNFESQRKGGALSKWWNNTYTKKFDLTEGTSLHSLRHTCITELRAAGDGGDYYRGYKLHRGTRQPDRCAIIIACQPA